MRTYKDISILHTDGYEIKVVYVPRGPSGEIELNAVYQDKLQRILIPPEMVKDICHVLTEIIKDNLPPEEV